MSNNLEVIKTHSLINFYDQDLEKNSVMIMKILLIRSIFSRFGLQYINFVTQGTIIVLVAVLVIISSFIINFCYLIGANRLIEKLLTERAATALIFYDHEMGYALLKLLTNTKEIQAAPAIKSGLANINVESLASSCKKLEGDRTTGELHQ